MRTIHTNRLVLRPFKEDDAKAMYKNWTYDERVAKYCRWHPHKSITETEDYLKMCLKSEYSWAIVLKDSDEPIGAIEVVGIYDENKTAEIGYVLSYDHWNKGYMSEAFKAVIDELFSKGFIKITATHHIDNPASGRVMEKCGMNFVCNDKGKAKFGSDELCDIKRYQINKM